MAASVFGVMRGISIILRSFTGVEGMDGGPGVDTGSGVSGALWEIEEGGGVTCLFVACSSSALTFGVAGIEGFFRE